MPGSLPPDFVDAMRTICTHDDLLLDAGECWAYGYDNSRRQSPPDAVVFARSHQQVLELLKQCNRFKVPIVARGRGTGTTGATVPLRGGVVLSFERMDKILELDTENRFMRVEPGVTNQAIQEAAASKGFFWPPDPTSAAYCTVGGNLAYNSAGPRAVKYGTPRENTLGLRAVTGDGKEIRTGVCTTKGVVGYDLTRLIIGSEGTLALITEATLKLTPVAEGKRTLRILYDNVNAACKAVTRIMNQAVIPYAVEFIDGAAIDIIQKHAELDLPTSSRAMLMVELDGTLASLDDSCAKLADAASGDGLLALEQAQTKAQVEQLWKVRKALSPALRTVAPKKINEDVVVPVSNIARLIDGLAALSNQYQIPIVNFGHAGNGNIHVNLLSDPDNTTQSKNIEPCLSQVFDLVLSLGGTLSGEHGVGIEKRDYIQREIDPTTLNLMKKIKVQFDPNNILNPDKIFPIEDTGQK